VDAGFFARSEGGFCAGQGGDLDPEVRNAKWELEKGNWKMEIGTRLLVVRFLMRRQKADPSRCSG
jgi:hypothetical protein